MDDDELDEEAVELEVLGVLAHMLALADDLPPVDPEELAAFLADDEPIPDDEPGT